MKQVLIAKNVISDLSLISSDSEMTVISAPNQADSGYWVGISHTSPVGGYLLWYSCRSKKFTMHANVGYIESLKRIGKHGQWNEMIRVDGRSVGTGVEEVMSVWFDINPRRNIPVLSMRTYERSSKAHDVEILRNVQFNLPPPKVIVYTKVRRNEKIVDSSRNTVSVQ